MQNDCREGIFNTEAVGKGVKLHLVDWVIVAEDAVGFSCFNTVSKIEKMRSHVLN